MNETKLTIWCNDNFRPDQERELKLLIDGTSDHQLFIFESAADGLNGDSRNSLADADIAFGSPHPGAVVECQKVRWVQLNSAGYTSFDRHEIKQTLIERQTILTNSSAVYSEPCAQHLLAMMLSLARQLPAALDCQRGSQSWPMLELRTASRLLDGQTVLILGYGAIARRLIELLSPFKLKLIAVRRHIAGDEEVPVVHSSRVDACLPLADHLVNVLPATDETRNFLNGDRLRSLKPGAIVYNIGRGTTVDQSALAKLLESNQIAAAYLDVTDPEPLPPDHPLWTTRNCFITPHTGGGHDNEKERQVRHFLDNLRRFELGEPLVNRII